MIQFRIILGLITAHFYCISIAIAQDTLPLPKFTETTSLSFNLGYPLTNNALSINLQSLDRGIDYLMDDRIPWMKKRNGKQKFLKAATRILRYAVIDRPISYNMHIANHEAIGHMPSVINNNFNITAYYQGLFYYPFKFGYISYKVQNPKDMDSDNKGYVSYAQKSSYNYSRTQYISMQASGVMAENVYRNQTQERWQKNGFITYADATTYFQTMFDNFNYIRQAHIGYTGDMENYLTALNFNYFSNSAEIESYPYDSIVKFGEANFKITVKDFHRSNYISTFSDPNAYFSLISMGNYFFTGRSLTKLPLLRIGQVRFMPTLSLVLSPFGLEYAVHSPLITSRYNFRVHLRYGQAYASKYYGIGIHLLNYEVLPNLIVEPQLELFAQPTFYYGNLISKSEALRKIGGNGFLLSARIQKTFEAKTPFYVDCRIGYKTAGFILGEDLTAYPIINVGMGFELSKTRKKSK